MAISNYFPKNDPASAVFNPTPSYDGDWFFKVDNLIKNSKKENGNKEVNEFLNKTYYEPLNKVFGSDVAKAFDVYMISTPKPDRIGRTLKYSKVFFFANMISVLSSNIDHYGLSEEGIKKRRAEFSSSVDNLSYEDLNLLFSNAFKERARKLKDLLDNELNSMYYESSLEDYAPFEKKVEYRTFLETQYAAAECFQKGMLKLSNFFDRELDYNELFKCFDEDTFTLLFAKIIYEFNLDIEREYGDISNDTYLIVYRNALNEEIENNKKYESFIYFTYSNGKNVKYTHRDFKKELAELLTRHPETGEANLAYSTNDEMLNKMLNIDLANKIYELYDKDNTAGWEFLPEGIGKAPRERPKVDTLYPSDITESDKKSEEELVKETNLRIEIMNRSGYIGNPIKGLNSFNGYYAFVYPSGKVILERFWENEKLFVPSTGNATYVMNIDNFIEMSKQTKTNLIEYMKNADNAGVKRIFHTSIDNWQRCLYNEINGTYNLNDALDFIASLSKNEVAHDK